jgi:hypothetical protein
VEKAAKGLQQSVVADGQAPEVAQPANRALDDPAAPGATQLPSILVGGLSVVGPSRDDRLDPPPHQQGSHSSAIGAPIRGQPRWPPDGDEVERDFEYLDFCRGRRVPVCSQRRPRAIDQYHPLCALAALGGPDFRAPLFAGAKQPSTKHSLQRSFCWSLRWASKARHRASSIPLVSHCWSCCQQGRGCPTTGQFAPRGPVHRIQSMPRSRVAHRPPFRARLAAGRWGRIWSLGHRPDGATPCSLHS